MWEQEQNSHELNKCFSLCASGQVSLSFGKLKTGFQKEVWVVSQWNHRSIQAVWLLLWANPSKTCVIEWGRTYDDSAGWGSALGCLQEMKLGSSLLTSLVGEHLNIWLPYWVVYRALACFWLWLPLGSRANVKKSSLKILDFSQGCHKGMQFSTINFTLCSVDSIYYFAVMWKCKTVLIILNFCSMFPWVLSEKSKYNVGDVVFVCVHLACSIILLTTLSSHELV